MKIFPQLSYCDSKQTSSAFKMILGSSRQFGINSAQFNLHPKLVNNKIVMEFSAMEIDESNQSNAKDQVVEYSKKNIGAMGRDDVINLLDNIDNRVEKLRKDAITLQDQRDHLLTRIDMLKNTEVLSNLSEADKEEVGLTLKRINERLQTVDINVMTVRDHSQVDSLHVVNHLIDDVIRFGDPIKKRQKCQEMLSACSSHEVVFSASFGGTTTVTFVDKKFEGHLLGCTLDDQKRIKKRLEALLNYLAHQIIMSE